MSGLAARLAHAPAVVEQYRDPAGRYAFGTYDHLYGSDGPLTPGDVLLANLLSLRLSARLVIPLFAAGDDEYTRLRTALGRALDALRDARPFEDHESVEQMEATVESLREADRAAVAVSRWTPVTVSKVLHRRRPHIVPLLDSRVGAFYGAKHLRTEPAARGVRAAMWEDVQLHRAELEQIAARYRTPDDRPLSVLRLVDILIWLRP